MNKNLESIAGGSFGFQQPVDQPLQVPAPTTSLTFDPLKRLYVSESLAFDGKAAFLTEINSYLHGLSEPFYVFINYSQDVSTESFLQRSAGTKPQGVPDGTKYLVLNFVNIPGSIKFEITGSQLWNTESDSEVKKILDRGIKVVTASSTDDYKEFSEKLEAYIGVGIFDFPCIGEAYDRYYEAKDKYDAEEIAMYAAAVRFWLCATSKEICKKEPYKCGFINGLLQEIDWITLVDDIAEFQIKKEDIERVLVCLVREMPIGESPDNPTTEDVIFKCLTGATLTDIKTGINEFIGQNWDDPYFQGQATAFSLTLIGPLKAGIVKKLEKLPRYASKIAKFRALSVAKNGDELVATAKSLAKGADEGIELVGKYDWNLIRRYFQHIQEVTGRSVHPKQVEKLKDALRAKEYKRLSQEATEAHRIEFNRKRLELISAWETNTGQKWPTYAADIFEDGKKVATKGHRYDAHHIIENKYGGENEWWNIHPAARPQEHQRLIHGEGSPALELFKN